MLPPVLLLAFIRDSHGYGIGGGGLRHHPSSSAAAAGGLRSSRTSGLSAGLRDLVGGPFDGDYSEYSAASIRDERNSVFAGPARGGGGGAGEASAGATPQASSDSVAIRTTPITT